MKGSSLPPTRDDFLRRFALAIAQRDELLAALKKLREEIDWITSQSDDQRLDALERLHLDYHSILHAADTAIARCQPAEKGAA